MKLPAGNSTQTAPARVVGRPFAPGTSGNPSGRPRLSDEAREALAILNAATPLAAKRLVLLLGEADAKVALPAVLALLQRVLGKEVAGMNDGSTVDGRSGLTFEQMLQLIEAAKRNGVDEQH